MTMAESDYLVRLRTLGRNDDCTCGSKKKYKKCHLQKDQEMESGALAKVNAEAKAKAEKEEAEHAKEHGHDHPHDHAHDHPHGHEHTHGHGHGPNAVKTPSFQVKHVSAPRKIGDA
jgi:hypothetical protein